jgi:pyruvate dehydrogenase E1 component
MREAPIVTVHDAASHTLAWMGSVFATPVVTLGVEDFGQSGGLSDLYQANSLHSGAIVNPALVGLVLADRRR